MKSNRGEIKDCPIVAFVDPTEFGNERGVVVPVVKSFVPATLFCVELHPAGNAGGMIVTESNV